MLRGRNIRLSDISKRYRDRVIHSVITNFLSQWRMRWDPINHVRCEPTVAVEGQAKMLCSKHILEPHNMGINAMLIISLAASYLAQLGSWSVCVTSAPRLRRHLYDGDGMMSDFSTPQKKHHLFFVNTWADIEWIYTTQPLKALAAMKENEKIWHALASMWNLLIYKLTQAKGTGAFALFFFSFRWMNSK